jgi:PAS domain-containing protein
MVRKYMPEYAKFISPLPSPVRAHCRLIKEKYGSKTKVVFFGPCAAKKNESDAHGEELALAIVFPALEQLFSEKGITFGEEAELALGPAEEGRFYSVEGGMNDTLRDGRTDVRYISVSGLEDFRRMLEDFDPKEFDLHPEKFTRKLFVEVLACPGGCVNGPAMPHGASGLETLFATDAMAPIQPSTQRCFSHCGVSKYEPVDVEEDEPTEDAIAAALARVGKYTKTDELNCGACGYDTCREFAKAFIAGKAEEAMCHTYLKKNFERTSNALIKYIPAGVVIIDSTGAIKECNSIFAEMAGAKTEYETLGNLDGLTIDAFMPEFKDLFTGAIEHGSEIVKYRQSWNNRIVTISVFPISLGEFAGAVIQDVTKNEGRREEIAAKARDVIRKNVYTVQQVARLFGEHIAETEIMLNEIAGAYESHTVGKRLREGGSEEYLNG